MVLGVLVPLLLLPCSLGWLRGLAAAIIMSEPTLLQSDGARGLVVTG